MATIAIAPSLPRIYWNEARFELLKLSRNRSYLFSMIGFPVIFYLLFGVTNKGSVFHGHTIARYLLAGYSCFGAMGSSLFGIGAGLAFERGPRMAGDEARQPDAGGCLPVGKAMRRHYLCGWHHHFVDDSGDGHGRRADHSVEKAFGCSL